MDQANKIISSKRKPSFVTAYCTTTSIAFLSDSGDGTPLKEENSFLFYNKNFGAH